MSIYEDRTIMVVFCILAAIVGAVSGSFLNGAAWRIAYGKPKKSTHYLLSGVVFSVMTVMCLLKCDLTVLFLRNMVFLCCLFCLSLVDMERYFIPDGCLLVSTIVWIVAIPFAFTEYGGWSGIGFHLLAAVAYGGGMLGISLLMDCILQKESLGGGDIKLFAVMGLYLGMTRSLFALFFACILGLVSAVICRRKEKDHGGIVPFGPAIALSTWLMLLYGSNLC